MEFQTVNLWWVDHFRPTSCGDSMTAAASTVRKHPLRWHPDEVFMVFLFPVHITIFCNIFYINDMYNVFSGNARRCKEQSKRINTNKSWKGRATQVSYLSLLYYCMCLCAYMLILALMCSLMKFIHIFPWVGFHWA